MADRVAIIGGSTVGRDHFPFPIPDMSGPLLDGAGSFFPSMFTADQLCRWYFIVKKWRFELEVSYTLYTLDDPEDPEGGSSLHGGIATITFDFEYRYSEDNDPVDYSSESQLVLPQWQSGTELSLSYSNVFADETAPESGLKITNVSTSATLDNLSGETLLVVQFDQDPVLSYWRAGIFPNIFLGMNIGGEDIRTDYLQNPLGYTRDLGFIIIDGVTVPAKATDLSSSPPYFDAHCADFTLSVNPLEYWPYATKAGLPVYDTEDGTVLNDPFS